MGGASRCHARGGQGALFNGCKQQGAFRQEPHGAASAHTCSSLTASCCRAARWATCWGQPTVQSAVQIDQRVRSNSPLDLSVLGLVKRTFRDSQQPRKAPHLTRRAHDQIAAQHVQSPSPQPRRGASLPAQTHPRDDKLLRALGPARQGREASPPLKGGQAAAPHTLASGHAVRVLGRETPKPPRQALSTPAAPCRAQRAAFVHEGLPPACGALHPLHRAATTIAPGKRAKYASQLQGGSRALPQGPARANPWASFLPQVASPPPKCPESPLARLRERSLEPTRGAQSSQRRVPQDRRHLHAAATPQQPPSTAPCARQGSPLPQQGPESKACSLAIEPQKALQRPLQPLHAQSPVRAHVGAPRRSGSPKQSPSPDVGTAPRVAAHCISSGQAAPRQAPQILTAAASLQHTLSLHVGTPGRPVKAPRVTVAKRSSPEPDSLATASSSGEVSLASHPAEASTSQALDTAAKGRAQLIEGTLAAKGLAQLTEGTLSAHLQTQVAHIGREPVGGVCKAERCAEEVSKALTASAGAPRTQSSTPIVALIRTQAGPPCADEHKLRGLHAPGPAAGGPFVCASVPIGASAAAFGSDLHACQSDGGTGSATASSARRQCGAASETSSAEDQSAPCARDAGAVAADEQQVTSERVVQLEQLHVQPPAVPTAEPLPRDASMRSATSSHSHMDLDYGADSAPSQLPDSRMSSGRRASATSAEGAADGPAPCGLESSDVDVPSFSGRSGESSAEWVAPESSGSGSNGSAAAAPHTQESENDRLRDGVRVLGRRYHVQKCVGEGAYGRVMRCAVAGEPGRVVAVKEFKISDTDPDAEDVKRTAHREARLMSQLQHAHVVKCVDSFLVCDRLFIVMEFMPRTLLDLLEATNAGRGLPAAVTQRVIFQLVKVMTHIHDQVRRPCLHCRLRFTACAHAARQLAHQASLCLRDALVLSLRGSTCAYEICAAAPAKLMQLLAGHRVPRHQARERLAGRAAGHQAVRLWLCALHAAGPGVRVADGLRGNALVPRAGATAGTHVHGGGRQAHARALRQGCGLLGNWLPHGAHGAPKPATDVSKPYTTRVCL